MSGISFGMIALNAQPFMEYNIRSLYPFAQQIIVVEGATEAASSLADNNGHSLDGSFEFLQKFMQNEDPEQKLVLVSAKDEGFESGFWPEKDQMSRAYAKRATGDWLWQVDSDEFYHSHDIEKIQSILAEKTPSGISFPFIEFWGSFSSYTTGKWYIQNFQEVPRIFRWQPGYQYASHRPPTVHDQEGHSIADGSWISGEEMKRSGIFMHHYSYVLPKQAKQKVGYYANVEWTEVFRDAEQWEQESFRDLRNPFFVGERKFPMFQWLERFKGSHPKAILQLQADLENGKVQEAQRNSRDIEQLLNSLWYPLATKLLRLLLTPYWHFRSWLKHRDKFQTG